MQAEEVTEIPLIYPLVSVTLKTCTVVDGRPIVSECEEVMDLSDMKRQSLGSLIVEFRDYVEKVIATAQSPQARDALQNILDNHSRDPLPNPVNPPLKPGSLEGLDQRSLPAVPPVVPPDSASS